MAQGADPLLGAYVKYKRAEEHFRDLVSMIAAFKKRDPYSVVFKPHSKTGQDVAHFTIRHHIPADIPLRAGEVIQCLRSCFDYIACELVTALCGASSVTTRTALRYYSDRPEYEAARQAIEKTMGKAAVDALDIIKPYAGGNDAFVTLCKLNDREKHRFLVTTGLAMVAFNPGGQLGAASLGALQLGAGGQVFRRPDAVFPLQDGTELPLRRTNVNVNPQVTFEIAFNEPSILQGETVIETLERFRYVALNTIAAFDPILKCEGIVTWLNRQR